MENKIHQETFESLDKNHLITTSISKKLGWFKIEKINAENFKTFVFLLKDIVEYYHKNNVEIIKQFTDIESIKYCKFSKIINLDDEIYEIETELKFFMEEIINLLNIQKL